jgi:hypothetical protein
MTTLHRSLVGVHLATIRAVRGVLVRGERGDVPGWVLITLMTAGLVAALWAIAGPELGNMLRDALRSVRG